MARNPIVILVILVALSAAACTGSSNAPEGVASLDPTTATRSDSDEASSSAEAESAMLAFTQCLRDGGIDVGDPVIDENGNPQLPPISFESEVPSDGSGDPEAEMKAVEEVMSGCEHHLEGIVFNAADPGDMTDIEDAFLAYAKCMRDHGVEMSDPDVATGGVIDLGSADPMDAGYEAAHDECKGVFTGSGIDLPGL